MVDDSSQQRRSPSGTLIREPRSADATKVEGRQPDSPTPPTNEVSDRSTERDPVEDLTLAVVPRQHYRVLGEFARGGLGRILRAEDRRLDRIVALKELHFEHPAAEARFIREVRVTARLQHPNIVPVHEAGRWPSGAPFYAMKLVDGRALSAAIAECETFRERLDLVPAVLSVVEAMAYAHSQRIIHRDLKPANVLVGAFGETVVIDWGLAKDLSEGAEAWADVSGPPSEEGGDAVADEAAEPIGDGVHTAAGAVMGTPAYMPPEQAAGEVVDETADVYALGAILYHVIAGERPYGARRGVLQRVRSGPPPGLEELVPEAPADLVAIVEKAMARERDDRYRDAAEMAEELRRYTTGGLVGAYEYSTWELLLRFIRRQRTAVLTGLLGLAALGFFGVVSIDRITEERDRAAALARQADERANLLVVEKARTLVDSDPTRSVAWLKTLSQFVAEAPTVAARAEESGVAERLLRGHRDRISSVAFAPVGDSVVTASFDKSLRVWSEGRVWELEGHRERVTTGRWSPDGTWIASGGYDGMVRLWRPESREAFLLAGHEGAVREVAFAPGGETLFSVGVDGLRSWAIEGRTPSTTSVLLGAGGELLRVAPDGRRIAVAGARASIHVYDLSTQQAHTLLGHHEEVRGLAFIAGTDDLISVGYEGTVRRWRLAGETPDGAVLTTLDSPTTDVAVGRESVAGGGERAAFVATQQGGVYRIDLGDGETRLLVRHGARVARVVISGDGGMVASASWDKTVRLVHLKTGVVRVFRGHNDAVTTLDFSADGQRLVSGSRDKTARIWKTRRFREADYRVLEGDPDGVHAVAWSPDGEWLAAGGHSNTVRSWRAGGTDRRVRSGHQEHVFRVRFSPDSRWIASSSDDQTVRVWPVAGGEPRVLQGHEADVEEIAFSPDGRLLASAGEDNTARLWQLAAARESGSDAVAVSMKILPHDNYVTAVQFDTRGSRLVTASRDHMVRLWDVNTGGLTRVWEGHTDEVRDAAFSPDGTTVASAGADDAVRLWRVDDARAGAHRSFRLTGAERLAFSPDGRSLAVAGVAPLLWLCEVAGNQECRPLVGHGARVHALAWSPDGKHLVTSGGEGWVIVWELSTGERRVLEGHSVAVYDVSISPDGARILSGSGDGTVRLWPLVGPPTAASLGALLGELSAQPATEVIAIAGPPPATR